MDSVPDSAVCNEAVKLVKRKGFGSLSGFVNGVLRNISRNLSTITYPDGQKDQIQYLSVRYSMPEWIVRQWINDYGMEQTVSVLKAFLQETPVTIRTNLLKITPEALEKRLKEEGVTAEKMVCADMPELNYAFMISGFDHLNALASFREGLFYVQDVSALSVALYGMFLAIIIPPARKDKVVAALVAISFALSFAGSYLPVVSSMSSGTRTIILTVVISSAAAILFPRKTEA